MTTRRLWFVTGAGRGLGRAITLAALDSGDRVVATARQPHQLEDLRAVYGDRIVIRRLDVDDRDAAVRVVEDVVGTCGAIDVVVNNAGWGLMGSIEEVTESEARAQMETNFLGALWVTQAVLPHLRARGTGHIIQMSTVGAIGTFPTLGLYNASKWALEGFSEALAGEVAHHGIRVTIVEPGGFATEWATTSMRTARRMEAYDSLRASLFDRPEPDDDADDAGGTEEGDPAEIGRVLVDLVNSPSAPLRILVGDDAAPAARSALELRRDQYEQDPRFCWPRPGGAAPVADLGERSP